jgi:geranylgeranylglycerol-phosphate geranylgeranyltransferase
MSYLRILRPSVCVLAVLAVIVGSLIAGVPLGLQLLIAVIAVFLLTGAGNVLNDYFDFKADIINRPKRPIPAGKIRRKDALVYSIILFIIGLSLVMTLNIYNIALAFFNAFLMFIYYFFKKVPLIGNFIPSWMAASAFLFGGLLSGSIPLALMLFVAMAFFANTGREIAKSIEDVKGDRRANYNTLPIFAGKKASNWIAILFVLIAILISPFPYLLELLNIYYFVIVLLADLVFIYSFFVLLRSATESQAVMKTAMFISILAFVMGIL